MMKIFYKPLYAVFIYLHRTKKILSSVLFFVIILTNATMSGQNKNTKNIGVTIFETFCFLVSFNFVHLPIFSLRKFILFSF